MRAPSEGPREVCSTISRRLVRCTLAPMVSQSMPSGSSVRRSITSASIPDSSAAATLTGTMLAQVTTVHALPARTMRALPKGMQ